MQARDSLGTHGFKDIADWFADHHGDEYDRKVTAKWVGWIIRRRLHLQTEKRHGVFAIADGSLPKLERLYERHGVSRDESGAAAEAPPPNGLPRVDMGDVGDVERNNGGANGPLEPRS